MDSLAQANTIQKIIDTKNGIQKKSRSNIWFVVQACKVMSL